MEKTEGTVTRIRANVATTTKGVYTFEVTSEAPDVGTMEQNLKTAIDSVHKVMSEQGYKEAGKDNA